DLGGAEDPNRHWPRIRSLVPFSGLVGRIAASPLETNRTIITPIGDFTGGDTHEGVDINWHFDEESTEPMSRSVMGEEDQCTLTYSGIHVAGVVRVGGPPGSTVRSVSCTQLPMSATLCSPAEISSGCDLCAKVSLADAALLHCNKAGGPTREHPFTYDHIVARRTPRPPRTIEHELEYSVAYGARALPN